MVKIEKIGIKGKRLRFIVQVANTGMTPPIIMKIILHAADRGLHLIHKSILNFISSMGSSAL